MICTAILCTISGCTAHSAPGPIYTNRGALIKDYRITASEVTYGDQSVEGMSNSLISVQVHREFGYNCISLLCAALWEGKTYELNTGIQSIGGNIYDVFFKRSSFGSLTVDGIEQYEGLYISVDGWIKEVHGSSSSVNHPDFECDLELSCKVDGKPLNIKITAIEV